MLTFQLKQFKNIRPLGRSSNRTDEIDRPLELETNVTKFENKNRTVQKQSNLTIRYYRRKIRALSVNFISEMVIKTGSSPSKSPVTITVTSGGGSGGRCRGLTSPIQRLSFSNNSPLSSGTRRKSTGQGQGPLWSAEKEEEEEEAHLYTVSIPQTPEATFQSYESIMSNATTSFDSRSDVSKTIFTGGYGSGLKGRAMEKSMEMKRSELVCGMRGCNEVAMEKSKLKCECGFKICKACYSDRVKNRDSKCPGCNELYQKQSIETEQSDDDQEEARVQEIEADDEAKSLPSMKKVGSKPDMMNFSVVQSFRGGFNRHGSEFDHARWLYDTQGTYGYGNAYWPKDSGSDGFKDRPDFCTNRHRPLTRKINVPNALISPYRYILKLKKKSFSFTVLKLMFCFAGFWF